jgi:hypothetical protein
MKIEQRKRQPKKKQKTQKIIKRKGAREEESTPNEIRNCTTTTALLPKAQSEPGRQVIRGDERQ